MPVVPVFHPRREARRAVKRGYPRRAATVRLCRSLDAVEALLAERLVDAVVLDVKTATERALALRGLDHLLRGAVLHAAAGAHRLQLRVDDAAALRREVAKAHERRAADQIERAVHDPSRARSERRGIAGDRRAGRELRGHRGRSGGRLLGASRAVARGRRARSRGWTISISGAAASRRSLRDPRARARPSRGPGRRPRRAPAA